MARDRSVLMVLRGFIGRGLGAGMSKFQRLASGMGYFEVPHCQFSLIRNFSLEAYGLMTSP